MKTVVFEVWSDYAHFRKPYTTTSALSFAVPPITAAAGLVGAIMGIESGGFGRSSHLPFLRQHRGKFAVSLGSGGISKTKFNVNYLKTKPDKRGRSIQVPVELVREPRYRLYVSLADELLTELTKSLQNGACYYTPYLGLSEFIATFKFIDLVEFKNIPVPAEVHSLVPLDWFVLEIEPGKRYFRETHSVDMDGRRRVARYVELAYEGSGKAIRVASAKTEEAQVWEGNVGGSIERVVFL
ncbi:MAG: type I-B CRISPR-associated protein Cas5b [Bacillota bacterium]